MKKKKHIFLFGTDHHCFQVDFAIKYFNILPEDVYLIFVCNKNFSPKNILEKYSNLYSLFAIDNWSFLDLLNKRKNCFAFIDYLKLLKGDDTEFFLYSTSAYEHALMIKSIVNVQKTYLMDDGFGHFSNLYFYKSKGIFLYKLKLMLKSFFIGLNIKYDEDFFYFTEHEFIEKQHSKVVKYEIEKFTNPMSGCLEDEVWFLGLGLVEANIMSQSNYMIIMKNIVELYKGKSLHYFPHRVESNEKLFDIQRLGFKVAKAILPFEEYFKTLVNSPAVICSLYNTAVIYNIAKRNVFLPHIHVINYDIKMLKSSKEIYQNILGQYQLMENVEIIYLTPES